jgi:Protein of unknown function (DUF2637)
VKRKSASDQREVPAAVPQDSGAGIKDVIAAFLLAIGSAIELRPRSGRRAWIAAVPIVIVNYVAFRAQLRFWQSHLGRSDAVLVSVALESIAIFWAWLAHQAMIEDDSALRPRLAAYGMALVIGALNYSHYCGPGWKPTVPAVTFGLMSVVSPWLWAGYSRRISRPILKSRDLIEDHAVRLGITRWFWHPFRCFRVMHAATWIAENRPAEAIKLIDKPGVQAQPGRKGAKTPPPDTRVTEPGSEATAVADDSAAVDPGLAAARDDVERHLIRKLTRLGHEGGSLPGRNELSRDPALAHLGSESTRKRFAGSVLRQVKAGLNGVNGYERDNS